MENGTAQETTPEAAAPAPQEPAEKGWDGWESVQQRAWFQALPEAQRSVLSYGIGELARKASLSDLLREGTEPAEQVPPVEDEAAKTTLATLQESLRALQTERDALQAERDALRAQVEDGHSALLDYRLRTEYADIYEDFKPAAAEGQEPTGLYVQFIDLLQREYEKLPDNATEEQVRTVEQRAATMTRALRTGQPRTPPQHAKPPSVEKQGVRTPFSPRMTLKQKVESVRHKYQD